MRCMQSDKLRKQHIQSFAKLSLCERLFWAFDQHQLLTRFMNPTAKRINKNMRRNAKKYFKISNLV